MKSRPKLDVFVKPKHETRPKQDSGSSGPRGEGEDVWGGSFPKEEPRRDVVHQGVGGES